MYECLFSDSDSTCRWDHNSRSVFEISEEYLGTETDWKECPSQSPKNQTRSAIECCAER